MYCVLRWAVQVYVRKWGGNYGVSCPRHCQVRLGEWHELQCCHRCDHHVHMHHGYVQCRQHQSDHSMCAMCRKLIVLCTEYSWYL